MSKNKDNSLILNEIKFHYNFEKDAHFAKFLGIAPTTLASWHSRNRFDYDLVYAKCEDIDGNWLLTGEGPMLREEVHPQEVHDRKASYDRKRSPEGVIDALKIAISTQEQHIRSLERTITRQEKLIETLEKLIDHKSASQGARELPATGAPRTGQGQLEQE